MVVGPLGTGAAGKGLIAPATDISPPVKGDSELENGRERERGMMISLREGVTWPCSDFLLLLYKPPSP